MLSFLRVLDALLHGCFKNAFSDAHTNNFVARQSNYRVFFGDELGRQSLGMILEDSSSICLKSDGSCGCSGVGISFVGHADNVLGVGKNDGARIGFPAAPAYVPSGVVIVDEFEGVDGI